MDENSKPKKTELYLFLVTATNEGLEQVTKPVLSSCESKSMEGFLKAYQGSRDIKKLETKMAYIVDENGIFVDLDWSNVEIQSL